MAVVDGTNSGILTGSVPTDDPAANNSSFSNTAKAVKVTIPTGKTAITDIGWWNEYSFNAANAEVGIYSDDGGGSSSLPSSLLYVSRTNSITGGGWWQLSNLNFPVTAGTAYWIAVQVDTTSPNTNQCNFSTSGAGRYSLAASGTATLPNTWSNNSAANRPMAIWGIAGDYVAGSSIVPIVMAMNRMRRR